MNINIIIQISPSVELADRGLGIARERAWE
jgi:hypothetical protein